MKLCPKCQKQFSDDANFCPVDAARLVGLETPSEASDALSARFELGESLGGSRTGAVHRATDKTTGQAVAVKIIASAVVALPGLAQRLERELKQLERVQSGGVARVIASGKRGDDSWLAMELLDDPQTLAEAVGARGAMPIDKAARLISVIGEALIEAAQVGVVHRDLAPKNIVFSGDDLKIINFSLPVPTSDKVPGVPEFVAPEQHEGKPVDQRSNLYSLGAMYYFVLAGQPVQIDDAGAIKPPSSLAEVPEPLEALILRTLDRSPTRRFLTVRQLIDEVGRVARGEASLRSTQPLGRAGKVKAELVDTLPGEPPVTGTIIGVGLRPAAPAKPPAGSLEADASEPARSPWAPPEAPSAPPAAVAAAPVAAPPAAPAAVLAALAAPVAAPAAAPAATPAAQVPLQAPPIGAQPLAVPVAAPMLGSPMPASPVLASPMLASPMLASPMLASPMLSSKKSDRPADTKGKFRETMWFKKGELDAQAAQAAAEEHARTGVVTPDRADLLPLDERYKDDGSLSRSDKDRYSLRTGATAGTKALRESAGHTGTSGKVSEDELIGEMKGGRNKIIAIVAVALVMVAVLVFLIVH